MFKIFLTGSTAGLAGSIIGLGGGFVAIPMLARVTALTQHQIQANSLGCVLATGVAGSIGYLSAGHSLDVLAAACMTCGGLVTAPLGARYAARLSGNKMRKALGLLMLGCAPLIPLKDNLTAAKRVEERKVQESGNNKEVRNESELAFRVAASASIGGISGFLAGMFGYVEFLSCRAHLFHIQRFLH
jgi:uncharacterized membrane protein YfcA